MLAHPLQAPIRKQHGSFAGQSSTLRWTLADRQIVIAGYCDGGLRAEVVS